MSVTLCYIQNGQRAHVFINGLPLCGVSARLSKTVHPYDETMLSSSDLCMHCRKTWRKHLAEIREEAGIGTMT